MNTNIDMQINKLTMYYDDKVNELIKEKELLINNWIKADEIIKVFEKSFKKLKFKSIKTIHVDKTGRIILSIEPEDTFKFYVFRGYKKDGSSSNYNRMVTKANKLSNDIELILAQFNVGVSINQYSFEISSENESKTILMDIYYK